MQIQLMTASLVKSLLGITSTEYDTKIATQLPLVSMDVRKYLNNNFQKKRVASYEIGGNTIQIGGPMLDMGTVLQGTGIPEDTFIQSYDVDSDTYTVSETFTDFDDWVYPTISINQWTPISRMVLYKVLKMSVSSVTEQDVTSRSIDATSWTFSHAEINKKYGYPQKLLDELGAKFARVG